MNSARISLSLRLEGKLDAPLSRLSGLGEMGA